MGCDVTNLVKTQIGTDGHHFGRSRWASKAFSLHSSAPDLFQSFSARHRLQLKICNTSYRTSAFCTWISCDMKNVLVCTHWLYTAGKVNNAKYTRNSTYRVYVESSLNRRDNAAGICQKLVLSNGQTFIVMHLLSGSKKTNMLPVERKRSWMNVFV